MATLEGALGVPGSGNSAVQAASHTWYRRSCRHVNELHRTWSVLSTKCTTLVLDGKAYEGSHMYGLQHKTKLHVNYVPVVESL